MQSGIVFEIREFTVFDGPGMRQTVFLKGCPLRCSWCHNPEGLQVMPQLMVSAASCTRCGRCMEVCPQGGGETAKQKKEAGPRPSACKACGKCVPICPLRLRRIAGERMTSQELAERVRRDDSYYAAYGGGVTFSGGEPLLQADFLIETLKRLEGVHRAIETSGYAEPEVFTEAVRNLDYVMMDIKLFDAEKHRRYTGVDNRRILDNARWLCQGETPFVIRIPVIPGVNDNEENFRQTAQWIAGAKKLERVELLPYHKTAGAKYEMAGKRYSPDFDPEGKLHLYPEIFREYGIRSEVL